MDSAHEELSTILHGSGNVLLVVREASRSSVFQSNWKCMRVNRIASDALRDLFVYSVQNWTWMKTKGYGVIISHPLPLKFSITMHIVAISMTLCELATAKHSPPLE